MCAYCQCLLPLLPITLLLYLMCAYCQCLLPLLPITLLLYLMCAYCQCLLPLPIVHAYYHYYLLLITLPNVCLLSMLITFITLLPCYFS